MTEIAPPRGAAPARIPPRRLLAASAAALAAAALFWSPLLLGGALSGRDWASHHWHYFDWVRTSLTLHGTLPLYMADAWITPNFLANAESPLLGPLVPLLWLLSTGAYVKLLIVLFTAAGLAGCFLLLRDLDVAAPIAAGVAMVFAWNGFGVSHLAVGHPWVLGAQLLPWGLLLYRRAALGSGTALWGAAALDAALLLGGQHQPFVWQKLFLGGFACLWALRVRAWFPLSRLALLWLAAAGLGAVKLVPALIEFAAYDPEARIAGLPPALLLRSLAVGAQHPGLAPTGLDYAQGSGWWEYAFYLGPAALLLLLAGLAAARNCLPLLVLGAGFAVLALDWSRAPLDPWAALEGLPVWRTQRAPSRFLFLGLFGLWLAAALGLERLYRGARPRWPRALPLVCAAGALAVGADLFAQGLAWQRSALGPGIESRDHRPRPLRLAAPGGARAELTGFAPNQLVYRVTAPRAGELVLPLRYGPIGAEWESELPVENRGGRVGVLLPAGGRDVVLRYRPTGLEAGLASSAATLLAFALWLVRRRAGAAP